jgi:tetratricopeptide (TPR) repeat protein
MSPRPVELPESGFEPALQLAREGRVAEALEWLRQAVGASDRESSATPAAAALAEVARLAEATAELSVAERALELAISLRPRYPDLHHQLGCVRVGRNRRLEARRSLETAIELNPRYTAARLELALLDAREGMIGEALDALRTLGRDMPIQDAGAFQQGLKRLERAEWEDAEPLLKRALAVSDPGIKDKLERFRAHLEDGEPARAVQALQDLLPRHQGYPDLHYLMGLAELKLSRYDDALASFARALELNPEFHDARVQLAQALECLGESASAGEQLAMVLERDPSNHLALDLDAAWSSRGAKDRRARRPVSGPRDGALEARRRGAEPRDRT